jgi:hypothetical protein
MRSKRVAVFANGGDHWQLWHWQWHWQLENFFVPMLPLLPLTAIFPGEVRLHDLAVVAAYCRKCHKRLNHKEHRGHKG